MRKNAIAMFLCLAMIGTLFSGCQGSGEPVEKTEIASGGVTTDAPAGEDGSAETGEEGAGEGAAGTETGGETADGGVQESGEDSAKVRLLHPVAFEYYISGADDANGTIMVERCGGVSLKPDEAAEWPELARALEAENAALRAGAENDFAIYYEDAKSFFDYVGYLSAETETHVLRADSMALSVRSDYSDYLGGAHGYFGTYGTNYDTASGKKLTIDDVVKDKGRLPELLAEKLQALPDAEDWLDCANLQKTLAEYQLEEQGELYEWLIDYDGVSFYFNPYSIAAYAAGQFTVKLFFDEYPDLFEEKYRNVPERYAEPLMPYATAYADLDGDGKKEEIRYHGNMNYDYQGFGSIEISAGGKTESFDLYCYAIDAYLLHMGEKTFLYAFHTGDNDFIGLEAYELSGSGVREVGVGMGAYCTGLSGTYGYRDEEEKVYFYESSSTTLTDPDRFWLVSQMYALGIVNGYKLCHIGEDGRPESDMSYFDLSEDWKKEWAEVDGGNKTFTALLDMEMQGLKADFTESGESVAVSTGAVLELLRTDGKSYVDFRLEDGRLVRAVIRAEDWSYTICGIPMEEALDGIFYAG